MQLMWFCKWAHRNPGTSSREQEFFFPRQFRKEIETPSTCIYTFWYLIILTCGSHDFSGVFISTLFPKSHGKIPAQDRGHHSVKPSPADSYDPAYSAKTEYLSELVEDVCKNFLKDTKECAILRY